MLEGVQGYAIGSVFGHVGIQIEYIDYLTRVHCAKSNKILPLRITSQ